jgi:hypothetical protein
MSKILFWSPYHGQGQTSNLYVVSLIFGLIHKKRVLLLQTHFKNNNLESPLVGYNVDKGSEETEIFEDIGIDMAITYSNMNRLNNKTLENCCLTFLDSSILMMPGTKTMSKETFDRDIGSAVQRMLTAADDFVDLVFIDSNSSDDELSMRLMQTADMIVINLTQRKYVLEKFFVKYGNCFSKNDKVFYLFGNYDDNSGYNIHNCRRKYSQYIKPGNSGVIPYCTKYMDAQNESNVLQFLEEGLTHKRKNLITSNIQTTLFNIKYGKYARDETDDFFVNSILSADKISHILRIPTKRDFRR